jgi:hypothetical protein
MAALKSGLAARLCLCLAPAAVADRGERWSSRDKHTPSAAVRAVAQGLHRRRLPHCDSGG